MDAEHYDDFGDCQGGESSSEGIGPVPPAGLSTIQERAVRLRVTQGMQILWETCLPRPPSLAEIFAYLCSLTDNETLHPEQIFVCRDDSVVEPVQDVNAFLPFCKGNLIWIKVFVERGM